MGLRGGGEILLHPQTRTLETLNSTQPLFRPLIFWIEGPYNRERRDSTIGYMSPIDDEQKFINTLTLTPEKP